MNSSRMTLERAKELRADCEAQLSLARVLRDEAWRETLAKRLISLNKIVERKKAEKEEAERKLQDFAAKPTW